MNSPSIPAPKPPPQPAPTHETQSASTGTGNRQSPFPPAKNKTWWTTWWASALGPEPQSRESAGSHLVRLVSGQKALKPIPLDLAWDRIGPPSPTWPPEFEPLWATFKTYLDRGGLPTPLDPENTWVVASPSADRTVGHRPILVSLPPDQIPLPGCVIVARRPQDQRGSRPFTVPPLGGFLLPPDEARAAAPGAVASASAWIGEVWKL